MIKHVQTICRVLPTNCLSVFDHFVGLALKGLHTSLTWILYWEFYKKFRAAIFKNDYARHLGNTFHDKFCLGNRFKVNESNGEMSRGAKNLKECSDETLSIF